MKTVKIPFYILGGLFLLLIFPGQIQAANISFASDTEVSFTGVSPIVYINSGSACDSLIVTASALNADISDASNFTLETTAHTILGATASGGTINVAIDTTYLGGGYISQWTASSTLAAATAAFSVGVSSDSDFYTIKVDGSVFSNYQAVGGTVSFTYNGGFSSKTFTINSLPRGGLVGGTTAPSTTSATTATTTTETTTVPTTKPVSEMSIEELKAEITRITALILQLQSQLSGISGEVINWDSSDFTFKNTLKFGMVLPEVKYLQLFLNSDSQTKLTDVGVGSPGDETNFFGVLTKAAVVKFQEKYASEILTPLGLTKGTGIVGKATINKINSLLGK
ncbi:MAG: peptidoglycan-binding domain-containing protein [Candidatus Nealsonbacteria bacterium]|nr:peptidoglycan-binding domain-containing protein [Candidatus Nealsonbacteria bacterium]